jgi:hypothetical protein
VQVEGADFRFQERMRGVVEYMQYREMPAEIKRKVRFHDGCTAGGSRRLSLCGGYIPGISPAEARAGSPSLTPAGHWHRGKRGEAPDGHARSPPAIGPRSVSPGCGAREGS